MSHLQTQRRPRGDALRLLLVQALAPRPRRSRRAGAAAHHLGEGAPVIPPELRRMLERIAGTRTPGRIHVVAALVGNWTDGELLTFGFQRTADGGWLAPAEWRTA